MSATVRLQPVYSWKGVLKLFSCIAARTASKPKGNRTMLALFTTTTNFTNWKEYHFIGIWFALPKNESPVLIY